MRRLATCSVGALGVVAFAVFGAIPALATTTTNNENGDPPTIAKEVTSGPCLDDPAQQCPRTDVTNITIGNPSFESPPLGNGGFTFNTAVWIEAGILFSSAGSFNPITYAAPDGSNVGFTNSGSLSQTLSDTYIDGATYTLSLFICRRFNAGVAPWRVELLRADTNVVLAFADENAVNPPNPGCAPVQVQHTVSGTEAGQAIKIVLSSTNNFTQANWDDLSMTQAIEVTEVVSAVERGPDSPYAFDFTITVEHVDDFHLVLDTLPAEWIARTVTEDGTAEDVFEDSGGNDPDVDAIECGESWSNDGSTSNVTLSKGGKANKNCRSATVVEWEPGFGDHTLKIDADTRRSPGRGHAKRRVDLFAPTSCGALFLNDGAALWDRDVPPGEPPVLVGETPPLCLAVVADLDGDGIIDPSGGGDEDGDSLLDYAEACTNPIRTDPCLPDTDGDGVRDDVDQCPLQGLEVTGFVDQDGCPITP